MIRMARLLAPPLLLVLLGGFQTQPYYGPLRNGTLAHEDDKRRLVLHDTPIFANEERGVYDANFGLLLRKLEGQTFRITGYMLPLNTAVSSPYFILTRRSSGCPFCPPNEPTEAIQIMAADPIRFTRAPITVEGKLHLVSHSEDGLFYRLGKARLD
ncbi:DUF3299 domain-containing protein [Novosphingobium sp. KACC 22771]|uniref:DUF3299 domain-containing protein n=1 Tax=Novosphingobium sp. KACC 22771 TaxID=3025670 RepID=UPI002366E682|nr:DUF3299 domain-containing protein [Novosphingobium sp. KACC 22771]WDF70915.1 DUF3299 domain-containing protein [Novosphingobium sp. KACC 22771]